MKEVRVKLAERSYSIYIADQLLHRVSELLQDFRTGSRCAIVSNPTVFDLYGPVLQKALKDSGIEHIVVLIPDGEQYKDYFWAFHILTQFLQQGLDRGSVVFALGGGVIGDMAGFVSSVFMRGISCVQIPTTLLAQVDSSVGGKTGVNHPLGKNMIGTFYQPRMVIIDVQTLKTLPQREFLAGMAEVIKYAIIWDKDLFEFLKQHREAIVALEPEPLQEVIQRCCQIKAEVVSSDERESSLRAILNFGHTVGHAIETLSSYQMYLHGEAVAIGMVAEARIARKMGLLSQSELEAIEDIISKYALPVSLKTKMEPSMLLKTMAVDKKARAGRLRIVLPEKIGQVTIKESPSEEILTEVLSRL